MRTCLAGGWNDGEPEGRWTSGSLAQLLLRLDPAQSGPGTLELEFLALPLLGAPARELRVEVLANGNPLVTIVYGETNPGRTPVRVPLPPSALSPTGELLLAWRIARAALAARTGDLHRRTSVGVVLSADGAHRVALDELLAIVRKGRAGDQRRADRGVLADRPGDRSSPGRGGPGARPAHARGDTAILGGPAYGFPGAPGFSPANLARMRSFALAWPKDDGIAQRVRDLPWGHIVELVQKLDDRDTRDWYAARAGSWSRAQLQAAIASSLHEREGAAITNFEHTLVAGEAEAVQRIARDPVVLDFVRLGDGARAARPGNGVAG